MYYLLLLLFIAGCGSAETNPLVPIKRTVDPGDVVLIGESRVEHDAIRQLCGSPVANLGYGGAKARDLWSRLPWDMLHANRPSLIILTIGVNDAWVPPTPLEDWLITMDQLYQSLNAIAPTVVSTIVMPDNFSLGLSFSHPAITDMNAALATQFSHALFDADALALPIRQQGMNVTYDGVHFTPAFYADLHTAWSGLCPNYRS